MFVILKGWWVEILIMEILVEFLVEMVLRFPVRMLIITVLRKTIPMVQIILMVLMIRMIDV